MATKAQAEAELAKLGFQLDPEATYYDRLHGHHAVIDPAGRKSIAGECRGHVVFDYTAKAAAFWDEVIAEARGLAPLLADCPHPAGECDMHDEAGDE